MACKADNYSLQVLIFPHCRIEDGRLIETAREMEQASQKRALNKKIVAVYGRADEWETEEIAQMGELITTMGKDTLEDLNPRKVEYHHTVMPYLIDTLPPSQRSHLKAHPSLGSVALNKAQSIKIGPK